MLNKTNVSPKKHSYGPGVIIIVVFAVAVLAAILFFFSRSAETSFLAHVEGTGTAHKYVIRPDRITLLLRGPENTLKKLVQGNGIQVHIALEGLKPGTYLRRAVIEPPLDTSLIVAKPEKFAVEIYK